MTFICRDASSAQNTLHIRRVFCVTGSDKSPPGGETAPTTQQMQSYLCFLLWSLVLSFVNCAKRDAGYAGYPSYQASLLIVLKFLIAYAHLEVSQPSEPHHNLVTEVLCNSNTLYTHKASWLLRAYLKY